MKQISFTPVTLLCCLFMFLMSSGLYAQTTPKDGQKVTITIETKDKNGNKSIKKEVHNNENLSDADIDRIVDAHVKENEGKDVKVSVDIAEEKAVSSEGQGKSKVIIKRQKKDGTEEIKDEDIKIIINGKETKISRDSLDKDMIIIEGEGGTSFYNLAPEGLFKSWGLSDSTFGKLNDAFKGFNGCCIFDGKKHGFLGVTEGKEKTDANGFIIGSIVKESPAEKAGLKEGDVITSIDDQKVNSFAELREEIRKHEPGKEVEIKYNRGGSASSMKITLSEAKEDFVFDRAPHGFNFHNSPDMFDMPDMPDMPDMDNLPDNSFSPDVHPYNWDMPQGQNDFNWGGKSNRPQLGVQVIGNGNKGGVEVQDVVEGSAAYHAGIHDGDVITKIDSKKINTPEELIEKIQNYQPGDEVKVQLLRDGKKKTINVVLGRQKPGYSYGYNTPETRKKKTYVFNGKNDQKNLTDAGTLKLENFEVFPNPSEGKVNIKFKSPSDSEMTLKVVDVTGKVIYTEDLKPENGEYNKSLELQNAKSGVYIVRIEQDGKLTSEKIIMNK